MKKYESVFILDIRKTDDNGAAFCNGFAELIKSLGGEIEKTVEMPLPGGTTFEEVFETDKEARKFASSLIK